MDRVDYQSLVVQDLINLEKQDDLNLSPWYQRRSVWNNGQKSYLINTLFEKKPIPALYFRHFIDLDKGKSIREVVDGQQRTRTILEYCNNDFTARHPQHNKRIKFSELTKIQKQDFLLTSIPIGFLLGATDIDVIDIFARINSVAKTLNAQEKRNANFSGEFKQFCVREATSRTEFWKEYKIFSANSIARMDEVLFLSDVIVNIADGLTSYSAVKINKYYKDYDDEFPAMENVKKRLEKVFDLIVSLNPDCIRDTIFNRPPIFFSLIMVLDSIKKPTKNKVELGIYKIDERYNSDKPLVERPRQDIAFYNACASTTQGIASRRVRDTYIRKFIE